MRLNATITSCRIDNAAQSRLRRLTGRGCQ
jgi:hypothetical protein